MTKYEFLMTQITEIRGNSIVKKKEIGRPRLLVGGAEPCAVAAGRCRLGRVSVALRLWAPTWSSLPPPPGGSFPGPHLWGYVRGSPVCSLAFQTAAHTYGLFLLRCVFWLRV